METYGFSSYKNITSDLYNPLHNNNRIKVRKAKDVTKNILFHLFIQFQYTCYDVSKNYIVCGATSGSLYIFERDNCKFLQLIPSSNGVINHVAISPKEQYLAFTTKKKAISIHSIDWKSNRPIRFFTSCYHEMDITQIIWRQKECQIIFGDDKGQVFLVNLNHSMVRIFAKQFLKNYIKNNVTYFFQGRNSFFMSLHPILFLETPIVQICEFKHLLLVSNYTKCVLCNVESEEFKQVTIMIQ